MNHLTEEQLVSLIDGGVPPNKEPALREHVARCAECRSSLEELHELTSALGANATVDDSEEAAHIERVLSNVSRRSARDASAEARKGLSRRSVERIQRLAVGSVTVLALAASVTLYVRARHDATR